MARIDMGEIENATADLAKAVELRPQDSMVHEMRGALKEIKGGFQDAYEDYGKAVELAKDDAAYVRFWLFLIDRRLKRRDPIAHLKTVVDSWKEGWPKTVGLFLTGQMTETAFMDSASKGDGKAVPGHQCEARYYCGMLHLLSGDYAKAKSLFTECVASGPRDFVEVALARAELARLAAKH
jgi:lipoprotein NlpI